MTKRSMQKKAAILNDCITKEIEKEIEKELEEMSKDNITAKNENKYVRQNYSHHSRSYYVT